MQEFVGQTFETHRSDRYLPIGRFILCGALLTIPVLLLATTQVIYLFPVPFAAILFGNGKKDREKYATIFAIVGAVLALAATILNLKYS